MTRQERRRKIRELENRLLYLQKQSHPNDPRLTSLPDDQKELLRKHAHPKFELQKEFDRQIAYLDAILKTKMEIDRLKSLRP
jgi:hypothetical protein